MALTPVQLALRAGRKAIKAIDGRTGTLSRSGETSVSIELTLGETRSEDYLEDNVVTVSRIRDFLIDVDQYAFAAGPVAPRDGDVISYAGENWTVRPTSSESEYRRSDRDGLRWRVHTKKTGV